MTSTLKWAKICPPWRGSLQDTLRNFVQKIETASIEDRPRLFQYLIKEVYLFPPTTLIFSFLFLDFWQKVAGQCLENKFEYFGD